MLTIPTDIIIEEWDSQHAGWSELLALVTQLDQGDWFIFTAEWHLSSHVLVARRGSELLGFLRFVLQNIGPDADCPPVEWKGENLREAKVIAFGVPPLNGGRASDENSRRLFDNGRKTWVVTKSVHIAVVII